MKLSLSRTLGTLALAGCLVLGTTTAATPAQAVESTAGESAEQIVGRAQQRLGIETEPSSTIRPLAIGESTLVPTPDGAPPLAILTGHPSTRTVPAIDYTAETIEDGTRFAAVVRSSTGGEATWDFGSGVELYPLSDGRVSVSDSAGNFLAGIDAPWAADAHGNAIATYFTAEGSRLVQHVETTADTAYPIVVDPTVKSYPGYWEVTFTRSESATVVGTVASCAALLTKSPIAALKALSVGCGVFAAFSTAQLAGGKCVRAHVVGVVPVIGTWWPTFPQC